MRWVLAFAICAALAGCNVAGDPSGELRWSHAGVPFSFAYPADFAKASIDQANSRGEVAGGVGLTKVDVIAVRPSGKSAALLSGPRRHVVLGQRVTSELHPVQGYAGWTLECQYTHEHATKLRNACARALATIRAH